MRKLMHETEVRAQKSLFDVLATTRTENGRKLSRAAEGKEVI